jgi:hypothetical protein
MPREIVTSENREEYMEKKLAEKAGKKMSDEEMDMKARAKKMDDEQFERVRKHPKYAMLKMKLGKRGAMDALLKELNDKQ